MKKVPPVVWQARSRVAAFRRRLHAVDFWWRDEEPVDLETLATVLLSCPIVQLPQLSENRALQYLERVAGIVTGSETAAFEPLAGALIVGGLGLPRWIFVEATDSVVRRRFTVAHEIGHLVLEAEPEVAQRRAQAGVRIPLSDQGRALRTFSRCGGDAVGQVRSPRPPRRAWTTADLREINANHFAAELLMPFEGVRSLISKHAGATGICTQRQMEEIAAALADRYRVSLACARTHLQRDLALSPLEDQLNHDLFQG